MLGSLLEREASIKAHHDAQLLKYSYNFVFKRIRNMFQIFETYRMAYQLGSMYDCIDRCNWICNDTLLYGHWPIEQNDVHQNQSHHLRITFIEEEKLHFRILLEKRWFQLRWEESNLHLSIHQKLANRRYYWNSVLGVESWFHSISVYFFHTKSRLARMSWIPSSFVDVAPQFWVYLVMTIHNLSVLFFKRFTSISFKLTDCWIDKFILR